MKEEHGLATDKSTASCRIFPVTTITQPQPFEKVRVLGSQTAGGEILCPNEKFNEQFLEQLNAGDAVGTNPWPAD